MGRVGIRPDEVPAFLDHCDGLPSLHVKGVMSHFASADEADQTYSEAQTKRFLSVAEAARARGVALCHLANSAGIFDLAQSHLDAVRPGIAIYGLAPSGDIANPRVAELRPVLDWTSRITYLKEVPAGTGLSYGHSFHTEHPSLIATIPVGYGDGLHRGLSNRCSFLVHGRPCPQVGRITMDQSLIDVTALRGQAALGDEVAIIGRQGEATATADEFAATLDTINYEIVTAIAARVLRRAVDGIA
jgi:alanine racemase